MRLLATLLLAGTVATSVMADGQITARFAEPTDRYAHAVLGDAIEYGTLIVESNGSQDAVVLPPSRVFEDIAPRRLDAPNNHAQHFVVVESHHDLGAQLAVYRAIYARDRFRASKRAATPHIGQRNRWLAPAAIADFDGDGVNDIAYVETPHLAGILKIVTLRGDELVPIATPKPGFSNHRIGQDFITSDARTCGGVTELLLPSLDWTTLMAARLENGGITARPLTHPPSLDGIAAAQVCEG